MGKLIAINISRERGTEKKQIPQVRLIRNYGLDGDAHAGRWHRQVSLLSYEKIEEFRKKGAKVENGAFGENLIISGFDFRSLPLGTRFKIGDAVLEMTQIGKECHSHCKIYERMGECIMPKEGVFAVVINGGMINEGDEVKMLEADMYLSIRDRDRAEKSFIATVVSGEATGQKAYITDGRIRVSYGDYFAGDIVKKLCKTFCGIDDNGSNDGSSLIKIGDNTLFIQNITGRPNLVICGGGHVAEALVKMAVLVDFDITVIEDRPIFAQKIRSLGVENVICDDYVNALKTIDKNRDNYFVCMTRGHRFDEQCIFEIFKMPYAYVGMMGSKRRSVMVRKDLKEHGIEIERINELHSPIGLSICAATPQEIALSVMSEIVYCKNKHCNNGSVDDNIIDELAKPSDEQRILCTIIRKSGSAPRNVGTQMIVTSDNRIIGTIGGGCAEAEIITRCRDIFNGFAMPMQETASKNDENKNRAVCQKDNFENKHFIGRPEIMEVSMNTDDAEKEGMVCGGNISVMLERM